MRVIARLLGASLLVLGLISAASVSAATIAGRVRDSSTSSYLLGATVVVKELDRSVSTIAGGNFAISNVPPGDYTLAVRYLGYDEATQTVTVGTATDVVRTDFELSSSVVKLGNFVVEGTREGQARALQQKRSAMNIMDAVSADAVGKFPDGNAAEALRRIPGVSLEIDQSEGRFVVVRGIDAALNNVTLNGQNLASPAEQGRRGLAMDSVPADLISRLEVVKAVTPDLDHTAIGGSVNIVTQSAFDRDEPIFFGSLSAGYNDFAESWGWYGGSATYGRVLDDAKRWGIIAGFSYSLREYSSQTSDAIDWVDYNNNGNYVPTTQESFDYDIERQRLGINVALEHRPSVGNELYLRVNYNEFIDEEGRQLTGFELGRGNLTSQTPTSGNFSQGRATKEYRDYKQNHLIQAMSIGGKHDLANDWKVEWQLGMSEAERETPRRVDWEFRSGGSAFPNSYVLGGEIPVISPNAAYFDPSAYPFRRVRFRTDIEQEEVFNAQLDFRRDAEIFGRSGYWKFGAKYVKSDKHQDRTNRNYNLASGAANAFTLGTGNLAGPDVPGYMNGMYRFGPTINLPALQEYFRSNPQRFAYDAAGSAGNSIEADFDSTEEATSAYGMASVNLTPRVSLLTGVRAEKTDASYTAYEIRNDVPSLLTQGTDYTQVLPGIHLTGRMTDRLVVRAAITTTYGRTNYTDLAPRNVVEDLDLGGGVFEGSLEAGNPNLKPFESLNFDASVEYYLKNGIVSVGLFHKQIDNPVYGESYTLFNTTYGNRNYSRLSVSRPENADSGEITGIELNYQQYFNMLPSPFDGLGLNLNYTITDSSATIVGRAQDVPFFKQSDEIGNVALVYEKYGIEARVAYAFNSDYLDGIGGDAEEDSYIDRRRVIDAKVSYRVHPRARIFAEFLNITKEPLRAYQGQPYRNNTNEIYSWNVNVGVNFNL